MTLPRADASSSSSCSSSAGPPSLSRRSPGRAGQSRWTRSWSRPAARRLPGRSRRARCSGTTSRTSGKRCSTCRGSSSRAAVLETRRTSPSVASAPGACRSWWTGCPWRRPSVATVTPPDPHRRPGARHHPEGLQLDAPRREHARRSGADEHRQARAAARGQAASPPRSWTRRAPSHRAPSSPAPGRAGAPVRPARLPASSEVDHYRLAGSFEPSPQNPQQRGDRLWSDSTDSRITAMAGLTPAPGIDLWMTYVYQGADKGLSPPDVGTQDYRIWDWPLWRRHSIYVPRRLDLGQPLAGRAGVLRQVRRRAGRVLQPRRLRAGRPLPAVQLRRVLDRRPPRGGLGRRRARRAAGRGDLEAGGPRGPERRGAPHPRQRGHLVARRGVHLDGPGGAHHRRGAGLGRANAEPLLGGQRRARPGARRHDLRREEREQVPAQVAARRHVGDGPGARAAAVLRSQEPLPDHGPAVLDPLRRRPPQPGARGPSSRTTSSSATGEPSGTCSAWRRPSITPCSRTRSSTSSCRTPRTRARRWTTPGTSTGSPSTAPRRPSRRTRPAP